MARLSESRAEHKLAGQEGTSDLGTGLRADYPWTRTPACFAGRQLSPEQCLWL
jgi:hypothetical protein